MRQEMGNMKFVLLLLVALQFVCFCYCQNSTLVIEVVEITNYDEAKLVCNVSSTGNLTRWTYLSESTETILMSFQNGLCTVSPSNSFLNDSRFSYTCNSTVYQVIILPYALGGKSIHNHILACRDALQPDRTDSTWIIKINQGNNDDCSYCQPTMTVTILEVTEGHNLTFECRVSPNVTLTNWNLNNGPNTAAMAVQNGSCITSTSNTFLDNTRKFTYTCNNTTYQVTRLNVQRNEHNDMYTCTSQTLLEGQGSNWIIKVKARVTSVSMTPTKYLITVTENTTTTFTCKTSTARPAASVYWYIHPNGSSINRTQITENITTTSDYNDLSVITSTLRFFPMRQHNDTKIFCKANNSLNTNQVRSGWKRLLNVLYKADDPYITQGNKYRVIENSPGAISCSVKGGNPVPTLSWSCVGFSATNQSTSVTDGNIFTILMWTAFRNHTGTCTCTSEQLGLPDNATIDIAVVVLYPPSKPAFEVFGSIVDGNISFIEGKTRNMTCTSNSNPLTNRYTWSGPTLDDSTNTQTRIFDIVKKNDAGQYKCVVENTMNPSSGNSVAGINNNTVNVVILYPPSELYFVYENASGKSISNKTITAIKGDTFSIVCKSMDGVPSPTMSWNVSKHNDSTLHVENLTESTTNSTCIATYLLNETGSERVEGNKSDVITFNILIPPTINRCTFLYKGVQKDVIYNAGHLKIIENESFSLNCSVEGKPTPIVWWQVPNMTMAPSTSVAIKKLTKSMKGDYVFKANSVLVPSFKEKRNVTVNRTVTVDVLYPPVVQPMNNMSILSGKQLNLTCNFSTGIPEQTFISWTRGTDHKLWNTGELMISSLTKNDTDIYTCTASNTMMPSGENKSYTGQHNRSFHLDVLYKASVTSFTLNEDASQTKIVNENESVMFICSADSNPTAVTALDVGGNTLVNVTSNHVKYNISKVKCSDAGTYFCSANNIYNNRSRDKINKEVELFVNYKPDPPTEFRHIEGYSTTSSIHLQWKPGFDNGPSQTFYIKYKKSSDTRWNYLHVIDSGEPTMELTLTELKDGTNYDIVIIASNEKGNSSESQTLVARTQAVDKPAPGALIGGIAGGVTGCIIFVIVIIVIFRRYPLFKRKGAKEAEIRRSVSDDSDEDDGLVDNPMYVSSNNVASAVPSSSGVITTPPKPKQASNEDLYTVVNKTKKQDKVQKGKTSTGKNASKGVDVYENVELANKPAKNDGSKQSPPKNESNRVPKLKVVNKDGLIYADLVFNDKPPGEKMVINGDDPTPYAFVDFTKKAEPLPESDNEDEK